MFCVAPLLSSAKESIGTSAKENAISRENSFFIRKTLISGEIRQVSSIIA